MQQRKMERNSLHYVWKQSLVQVYESANLNILQWNGLNGERLKFIIKESIEKFFTETSKRKLTELLQRTWN